jgi:hypothetical protein
LPFVEDLSRLPSFVIVVCMVAFFLSFGLLSNIIDNEGVLYNLGQGAFISVVTGAALYFARYLSRRRAANRVKLQPITPKETSI